ncbi:hypothetical protein NE865_10771 [Phthorimaea operculella]|nr:hypothetical protein NE865_10771 [Phthorimaea operculella]
MEKCNSQPNISNIGDQGDNVSGSYETTPPNFSDARRKRSRDELSRDDFLEFREYMKNLLNNWKADQDRKMKENQESMKKIENAAIFMSKQYEDLLKKVTDLENENKLLKQNEQENRSHIRILEDKVEQLERSSKNIFVEIRNVPVKQNENKEDLINTVKKISQALAVNTQPSDIRDAFRKQNKKGPTRPIVVELSSTAVKFNLLAAARRYNLSNPHNKLNASHIGFTDNNSELFLSEVLTDNAGKLYFLARNLKKSKLIDYCWTTNGKVYIRKRAGEPAVLIRDEAQIEAIKKED